jgi:putative ABC transport system permease protein
MIRNYIKTAWRSLIKNKLVSLTNILGLSIGMAACLLILEYVSFELSYDRFNENSDDIYRVYNDRYQKGKLIQHSTVTYSAVSKAMKADFPEVISYTRVVPEAQSIIFYNGKKFRGQQELFVENSFLTMFSYPLVAGDSRTALAEPHTIVITESLARRIFNVDHYKMSSVLGKTIAWGINSNFFKITGVCKDIPDNSHLQFDFLISYITLYTGKDSWKEADYNFTDSQFRHYIMLKHGTDYKALEAKFADFSLRHFRGSIVSGSVEKFYLQPLKRVHMYSDFEYDIGITTNATVVWGLFIIAALILIIAWINYVNLATAKSAERAKEVGVRKVAGATKSQLVRQFMTESLIINIFSLVIALIIIVIFQGAFNTFINYQLSLAYLFQKSLGGYSFSAFLVVSILSGIFISGFYPSFVLSSFKPILVLKGKFINSLKGIILRKALVIGQFTITVVLIISSFVVYRQMRFVSQQALGFNMSQMLIIEGPKLAKWDSTLFPRQNTFMAEITRISGVRGAAFSTYVPGEEIYRSLEIRRSDGSGSGHVPIRANWTSPNFINLYQIKMLAGRTLSNSDYQSNGLVGFNNLVLSLTAIKMLDFKSPTDAIGREILWGGGTYNIVGVIADFHQRSMHYPIEPTMFMSGTQPSMQFSVKVDPRHLVATIDAIKQKYNAMFPGNLFNYYFLDEKFNRQYSSDQLFGKVFAFFSGLAIFIACLGLFGLSLFATFQRSKEVGIRKVLGASIINIMITLSKDFMLLVLISILVASPIAWFAMHNWLQHFVIRINISFGIFIGAGLLALIIAFITISFQLAKAALANPVTSLRSE